MPGGVSLQPLANKPVVVEIRDATDALLSRQTVTTNANGSLAGSFQLAAEPTLGHWQIVVVLRRTEILRRVRRGGVPQARDDPAVTFDKRTIWAGRKSPWTSPPATTSASPSPMPRCTYHIEFDGADAEPAYDGQGTTDAQGHLHLDIATQRRASDRTLSVNATVTDLSRRSQAASGNTLIAAGLFRLSLETDKSVYRTGERVLVTVHSDDYDGKPVSARVRVRLIETKYDRLHRPYRSRDRARRPDERQRRRHGDFSSPRPGDLQLQAQAFDSNDDKIAADGSVWIAGDDYADYDYPTLELVAGRAEYAPGQTATILLNTSLVKRARPRGHEEHPGPGRPPGRLRPGHGGGRAAGPGRAPAPDPEVHADPPAR